MNESRKIASINASATPLLQNLNDSLARAGDNAAQILQFFQRQNTK